MQRIRFFFKEIPKNYWLLLILAIAFFLRIIGVWYSLPFRTNLDELGLVYPALKMIEMKTLIPGLHPDIFNYLGVYPPYASYVYIPFFLIFMGFKFLQFLLIGGGFADIETFKSFLLGNSSAFFIIARTISALFGLATVFLVYKASKNIFNNEKIALFSVAFLAFSFLHVSFSHVARHWIYATFFFACVIYALSRSDYSVKKRYTLAFLSAGLGMGMNYQVGLSLFFIAFWFLFFDRLSFFQVIKEMWVYRAVGLFLLLFALAIALNPYTTAIDDLTLLKHRDLAGLLTTFKYYIAQMFSVEFIFLIFLIFGFAVSFFKKRGYFLVSFIFTLTYTIFFYFVYQYRVVNPDSGRYLLMEYPLFAMTAGYGLYVLAEKLSKITPKFFVHSFVFLMFLSTLLIAVKFDYLFAKKDTRVQALEWIEKSLPSSAKFISFVPFMKLPATPDALKEQEKIDPLSVSNSDRAASILPQNFYPFKRLYAINLFILRNDNFKSKGLIKNYIESNNFDYLIYVEDPFWFEQEKAQRGEGLLDLPNIKGDTVKIFEGFSGVRGDVNNDFAGGLKHIINSKNNGPTIIIKKILKSS